MAYQERDVTQDLANKTTEVWQRSRFALMKSGTGTGKTYAAIAAIGLNPAGQNAHLVIFEPDAKKRDLSWIESIQNFNDAKGTHITSQEHTYYDLFGHRDRIDAGIQEHLQQGQNIIVIVDECHKVKNPTSKTGKALTKLINHPSVQRTLGLSATPYSNSYLDVIGYFIYAGFYPNKTQFLKEQIPPENYDKHFQPIVKDFDGKIDRNKFNNPDKIDQQLAKITINPDPKYLKGLLPPYQLNVAHYDLNKQAYVEPLFDEFEAHLNPKPKRNRTGQYWQALRYYQEGFLESKNQAIALQNKILAQDPNRLKKVLAILWDIQHSNDPHSTLIFYNNTVELEALKGAISKNLPNLKIYEVNGKQKDILKSPKETNAVVLIQYQAGGAAIEFKQSYSSIYYMPTSRYDDYKQTLGRNRRAGMKHLINYYIIMSDNKMDHKNWTVTIKNKEDFVLETDAQIQAIQDLDAQNIQSQDFAKDFQD